MHRTRTRILGILLTIIVALSVTGLWRWSTTGVQETDLDRRFQGPSAENWFGTDELGRDLLGRTLAGLGYSSSLVLLALGGSAVLGVAIGTAAGLSRRRFVGRVADQMVNVVWSIPGLVFFMAVTTYFGREFLIVAAALASVSWVPIARVVRLEVQRERARPYVTALRALGFPGRHVLRAVLANAAAPVGVATLTTALDLVAAESGLSFLGLGVQPPAPSLGNLVYSGVYYASSGWWLLTFPLVVLVGLVLALRWVLASLHNPRSSRGEGV